MLRMCAPTLERALVPLGRVRHGPAVERDYEDVVGLKKLLRAKDHADFAVVFRIIHGRISRVEGRSSGGVGAFFRFHIQRGCSA